MSLNQLTAAYCKQNLDIYAHDLTLCGDLDVEGSFITSPTKVSTRIAGGGQNMNVTPAEVVQFPTAQLSQADLTYAAGVFTVNEAGVYEVGFTGLLDVATSGILFNLFKNAFIVVSNFSVESTVATGSGVSLIAAFSCVVGDTIEIQASRDSTTGGNPVNNLLPQSQIIIKKF